MGGKGSMCHKIKLKKKKEKKKSYHQLCLSKTKDCARELNSSAVVTEAWCLKINFQFEAVTGSAKSIQSTFVHHQSYFLSRKFKRKTMRSVQVLK